ncbi:HK97 family phage major capsid protein [Dyadobacter sp. BE34]|uniref:HK97 family phage major capsid protein n=1 Tax=Dyadobacter fermentans TaxID=94254 RepID=A0ABU1QWM7_9BACT|nr:MULTISPECIES: phage major capsid protein [Dyadobacter]MDR6805564.1 HK97 family phage major capsid protein [Dyadobacter fermentans]MDR7042676.1 HK97 family phage major capsid protein [Dyadobacter sp. BE242]MDR7196988.1 HK97 family phage major capsid protein [Dyadobacter sp. BE34]MDR7215577.1 HK97 family phage major capsid protein [Dyadobacter sp. BE31]MDR7263113.1 HK97 family phage major capsid protein [Dyadobacter sp. BE32]
MSKKTLKDLQEERAVKRTEMETLAKESDTRALTPEERTQFSTLTDEVKELDEQIRSAQQIQAFNAGRAASVGSGEEGQRDVSKQDERDLARFSLLRALDSKLHMRELDGVEAEVQSIGMEAAKRDNIEVNGAGLIVMDSIFTKRGQTATGQTTNPGDQGGVLIREDVRSVLEVLQANTFLKEVDATFLTGLTGNLKIPVQDTVPAIQELDEIEEMMDAEILFSSLGMVPERRGVTIPISRQIMIQGSIDMEQFVISQIGEALAQKMNVEAAIKLLLIITSANGNLLGLDTNGALPTYEDIVELETMVSGYNHLRGKPKYLTNSKVRGILKTTQKFAGTNGEAVWDTRDNLLNGYQPVVSNLIPSNLTKNTGTNLSALIYGNFKDWIVGQWGGTEYIVDPYTAKKKAEIEVTVNAFWNQRESRKKSFAGIKDIVTVRP